MDGLGAYVALDRRLALARGQSLPNTGRGAALFADVSGFTALTEALAGMMGPRRGAEELSIYLNSVYEALVKEVHAARGSVVAFAGDAITCWFEGDDGTRALSAAIHMQSAMSRFEELQLPDGQKRTLAVKAGVACGTVRRFLVGDPRHHLLDLLAGQTLVRMANACAQAKKGEILVEAELARNLAAVVDAVEWRTAETGSGDFAVIRGLKETLEIAPWPECPALDEQALRPHLLAPIYERLRAGQGDFLTELRPAVAIFLRFDGIDYDGEAEAGERLDAYVRWVQSVAARYGGFLLAVPIGDKGSHLYCAFGAPIAHENSAWRALAAAHELRSPPERLGFITLTQIGISAGTMRTGAYGSTERRTYGVLGDDVNLAARLMEHAGPGQVLVSAQVRRGQDEAFRWQICSPIKAKGKAEPVAVFALKAPVQRARSRLIAPQYALPLVGRIQEVAILKEKLDWALSGRGQIVCITAEAGLGKSRLVAETIRLASELGLSPYVGESLSHGTETSYLVWQSIWRGFFDLAPDSSTADQIASLEAKLFSLDPLFKARSPLLAGIVNLPIPENEFTNSLEARLRKSSVEMLLVEALRKIAREKPLVLVLEDAHWMDALSEDLLEALGRAMVHIPVLCLLTSRPLEAGRAARQQFRKLPHFSEINLTALPDQDAAQLIKLKLEQLFDYQGLPPAMLVGRLLARSEGNPFYLEELLNFLKDQNLDFQNPQAIEALDLPDSLHSLVLSRVDRMTETQQAALKVASVIGRLFPAAVVWGIQTGQDRQRVAADLERLRAADLTALDRPEPELVYLFKHVVTQEATYESLPHATRAKLHNEIGLCLEQLYPGRIEQQLDLLAFHFGRSLNQEKKKGYLIRAGEAAQSQYANAAAIRYFERVLPLLSTEDRIGVLLQLGKAQELSGDWKRAGASYQQAFEAAESVADRRAQARCQAATGDLLRKQGMFSEAADWLSVARTGFQEVGDEVGLGQTLQFAGTVAAMEGNYERANSLYQESLEIRKKLGDQTQIASLLNNMGIIARFVEDYTRSRDLTEQALKVRREVGDRWAIANSLNNLGVVFNDLKQPAEARRSLEEALLLNRQVGDPWSTANTLTSLGEVAVTQRDWDAARGFLDESLQINLDLGDRTSVAYILECFAGMSAAQGKHDLAIQLAGAASALRAELGSPLSPAEQASLDKNLASARQAISPEVAEALLEQGKGMSLETAISAALGQDRKT